MEGVTISRCSDERRLFLIWCRLSAFSVGLWICPLLTEISRDTLTLFSYNVPLHLHLIISPHVWTLGLLLSGEIHNLSGETWVSVNYKTLIVKLSIFPCYAEALRLFHVVVTSHSHTVGPLSFHLLYLAVTQCKLSSSAQHLGGLRGCGINNLSEGFGLI